MFQLPAEWTKTKRHLIRVSKSTFLKYKTESFVICLLFYKSTKHCTRKALRRTIITGCFMSAISVMRLSFSKTIATRIQSRVLVSHSIRPTPANTTRTGSWRLAIAKKLVCHGQWAETRQEKISFTIFDIVFLLLYLMNHKDTRFSIEFGVSTRRVRG